MYIVWKIYLHIGNKSSFFYYTYNATFPGGTATGTVNEAGIFNNPSANSGTILCRTVFADVNKGASDAVVITWNVSVA